MKKILLLAGVTLLTSSMVAADLSAQDEVAAAAKRLSEKPNYSWKETVVVPESSPFKPGPTEGKSMKDGVTYFTVSFGDNTTKIYLKGDQAAVNMPEGDWQSAKELEGDEGPGRFISFMIRAFQAPALKATELAKTVAELTKESDVYSGTMTEAGAKSQFRFGTATDPKGSVKFWLKDGELTKYQFKLTGKVEFGGNEMEVDRLTTVEISDVGSTKLELPAEAKKKLEPAAPTPAAAPAATK